MYTNGERVIVFWGGQSSRYALGPGPGVCAISCLLYHVQPGWDLMIVVASTANKTCPLNNAQGSCFMVKKVVGSRG